MESLKIKKYIPLLNGSFWYSGHDGLKNLNTICFHHFSERNATDISLDGLRVDFFYRLQDYKLNHFIFING